VKTEPFLFYVTIGADKEKTKIKQRYEANSDEIIKSWDFGAGVEKMVFPYT